MLERFIERIAGAAARRPFVTLAVMLAVSAVALAAATRLPIRTSRRALLAPGSPEVDRFDTFLKNFGAASDLIVVVDGAPRNDLEEFSTDLARELRGLPQVKAAEARIDSAFFMSHAWTATPLADLDRAEGFIPSILRFPDGAPTDLDAAFSKAEHWFENPPALDDQPIDLKSAGEALGAGEFFLKEWLRWLEAPAPPQRVSWESLLKGQPEAQALIAGNGFYATHDGTRLFVFVRPVDPSEDMTVLGPFYDAVRRAGSDLRARWTEAGRTAPAVGLTGMPAVVYEEYSYIQQGVTWTIATAGVLVLLVIVFGLRSFRRAAVVFVPMGMGSLWGMALVLPTVGHLSMVTSAFSAILFGLGVDYGIFITSRIMEEQKNGRPLLDAIAKGTALSARAVLIAGSATALIFFSLGTCEFIGFRELGIVAGMGVLTVLLATFLGVPALYRLLTPAIHAGTTSATEALIEPDAGWRAWRMPRPLSALVVAVAGVVAAFGIYGGLHLPFNYDVLAMLPAKSEAANLSRMMVKESDYQSEVIVLTAKDVAQAREFAQKAAKLPTVAKVQSLESLFPPDSEVRAAQARRIGEALAKSAVVDWVLSKDRIDLPSNGAARIASILDRTLDFVDEFQEAAFSAGHRGLVERIERIRTLLRSIARHLRAEPARAGAANQRFLDRLLGDARTVARTILAWRDARPLVPDDLPPDIRGRFFGADGTVAVYVYPSRSIYDLDYLEQLLQDVYSVSPDATGFPTTHLVMSKTAFSSFYQGTILAAILALCYLLVVLRNLAAFAVAAVPLLIGEGWMMAFLTLTGAEYNYANLIAIPLLMALALDYGVWFAHRHRELAELTPWRSLRVAGLPILLAALTTLAGLGAIAFAEYRGIASLGRSVWIGLICCLVSAMLVSPAMAQLLSWRKGK